MIFQLKYEQYNLHGIVYNLYTKWFRVTLYNTRYASHMRGEKFLLLKLRRVELHKSKSMGQFLRV